MKKMNAKQRRELEQQKKAERIKQIQTGLEQKKNTEGEAKQAAKKAIQPEKSKKNPEDSKKTSAKAAGLKSTLVLSDGELLMTSFGKGNAAIIEKRIVNDEIKSIAEKPAFDVKPVRNEFQINGRVEAQSGNPLCSKKKPGQDRIGAKDALEKRFFGQTFADNIHIQLIYNILDIYKILAVHANNIVYSLDNLARDEWPEYDDFIGIGHLGKNNYAVYRDPSNLRPKDQQKIEKSRKEFDSYLKNPRLAYYSNAFYRKLSRTERREEGKRVFEKLPEEEQESIRKQAGGDQKKLNDKLEKLAPEMKPRLDQDIYYILYLMSNLRQSCVHDSAENRTDLFRLESALDKDAIGVLNEIYGARVSELDSVVKNECKSNFTLLFEALGLQTDEDKQKLAQQYYDFTVRKEFKNSGFSIRSLREAILLTTEAAELKDQRYNSVRSKLYQKLDFFLWRIYTEDTDRLNDLIARLRTTRKNEQKDAIYTDEAAYAWPKVCPLLDSVKDTLSDVIGGKIKSKYLKLSEEDQNLVTDAINGYSRKIGKDATAFSKLIYLMTLFLDGKEINDLLTTLRQKFEEIDSFLDVLQKQNLPCAFEPDYRFFEKSAIVADELQAINSFARMTREDISAKRIMFSDAAKILGVTFDEEELDTYLNNNILDKSKLKMLPNGTGFRNFIINNVIESSRFRYVVRYANPKKARSIIDNRALVELVLKEFPDTLINRYYSGCIGDYPRSMDKKIGELADSMKGLQFKDFENVPQKANAADNADKRRRQNLISLYLNVLYQVVKNLVYVNSRYTIAFHALEQDSQLLGSNAGKDRKNYCDLVQRFVNEKWLNPRACRYLQVNISNAGDWEIATFRNQVAHLGAVRNLDLWVKDLRTASSFYEVYHYLMQRAIIGQFAHDKTWPDRETGLPIITEERLNPKTLQYFAAVERYHTYCMDFVKALCAPFGYNLPRFKNLSVNALFDKNHSPKDGDDTMPERGC